MQTLEKRITKLEQASPSGEVVTFIHLVTPGDKEAEIQKIETSRQYWMRDAGETEEEFKDRAKREATPSPSGNLVFLCNSIAHAAGVTTDDAEVSHADH